MPFNFNNQRRIKSTRNGMLTLRILNFKILPAVLGQIMEYGIHSTHSDFFQI